MHNIFKELLKNATGVAKFVIAINIDVRGFSLFSKQVESPESALYIKKLFLKLINTYFNKASFFKSTGDGLIIIYDIEESDLKDKAQNIISICQNILNEFNKLCLNEPMINFKVPDKCGIGISRGPATCLITGDKVLDYSGDTLNIASRLMDCARPEGMIFDQKFGLDLLTKEQKELFNSEKIYLKGVAEKEPVEIYYSKHIKQISSYLLKPIHEINWYEKKDKKTFKEIKQIGGNFKYFLESKPSNTSEIVVTIKHQSIKSGKIMNGIADYIDFKDYEYKDRAGQKTLILDFNKLIEILKKAKVKDKMNIDILIKFPTDD